MKPTHPIGQQIEGTFYDVVIIAFICAAVLLAIWIAPSYFEAKAFNRLTGSRATTWDAMWVELRVMEGAR